MSSLPTSEATPTNRLPGELTVNLRIVSPSPGVTQPLLFSDLPATTTIKQLKEKIRQMLPLRPADENQMLIHRGRALSCDTDSLLDILGADALATPERHAFHLVVRGLDDNDPSNSASAAHPEPSVATSSHASNPPAHAQSATQQSFGHPSGSFHGRMITHVVSTRGSLGRPPHPHPDQFPGSDGTGSPEQRQQEVVGLVQQIQRDALARALVQQNQRGRAQMGMRGIGDALGSRTQGGGHLGDHSNGQSSRTASHPLYRETENLSRSSSTPGQGNTISPTDVHNILRQVDASEATIAMTTAMQRSISGATMPGRTLSTPGVTTPMFHSGTQMPTNGRATPDLNVRYNYGLGYAPLSTMNPASRPGTEVYILSSPEGPRALLVNHTTSETYYTPRPRSQNSMPHLQTAASYPSLAFAAVGQPQTAHIAHPSQPQQPQHRQLPSQRYQQPQQSQQSQQSQQQVGAGNREQNANQPPVPAAPQPAFLHPANPPAAGIPPLFLQVWPHIWLMVRLAVFIWLFTSQDASWSRWLLAFCLATVVFLLSTGILNGVVEHAWRPVGRHLENVLPTPDRHVRRQQHPLAGNRVPEEQRPLAQDAEFDPARMAARLMAERDRQSWLSEQLRRLERAGLLFLASIAPGVAERHIANLAAETEAEETRQRELTALAATQAEPATAGEATTDEADTDSSAQDPGNLQGNSAHAAADEQRSEGRSSEGQSHERNHHDTPGQGVESSSFAS